jgi:hypothetical protein
MTTAPSRFDPEVTRRGHWTICGRSHCHTRYERCDERGNASGSLPTNAHGAMRHVALHITSTHLARAHSRRHGPTTLATRAPSQRQWSPWTANPPPASRRERQSDEPSTTSPAQPTFRCQTARRRVVHPPHMANRTARGNAWDGGRAGERNEPDDAMDHHMNAARARRETKTPARALDHGRRNNWTSTFLSREVPWTFPEPQRALLLLELEGHVRRSQRIRCLERTPQPRQFLNTTESRHSDSTRLRSRSLLEPSGPFLVRHSSARRGAHRVQGACGVDSAGEDRPALSASSRAASPSPLAAGKAGAVREGAAAAGAPRVRRGASGSRRLRSRQRRRGSAGVVGIESGSVTVPAGGGESWRGARGRPRLEHRRCAVGAGQKLIWVCSVTSVKSGAGSGMKCPTDREIFALVPRKA